MARQQGDTTRMIDSAIQALFIDGEIFIPNKSDKQIIRGIKCKVFIDFEAYQRKGNEDIVIQQYLKDRIFKRLESEHNGRFQIMKGSDGTLIKSIILCI